MTEHPSLAGYAEQAPGLITQYERVPFDRAFSGLIHLFPAVPSRILDLGAGSGNHAAALAARGHTVVAVEPVREMREAAMALHPDAAVAWVNDFLPDLARLPDGDARGPYDFVLAWAVWMHLDPAERERGMARVAELLRPGGRFLLSLRHGPVPEGRRMFPVSGEETAALAAAHGFAAVHAGRSSPLSRARNVTWTVLCLDKSVSEHVYNADMNQPARQRGRRPEYPRARKAMEYIHKQTYSDQITEFIKNCILNGEYVPGDKINEVDLSTRLKVSRAPVREALQYLTQIGLLVSVPQKGKFIANLTAKEIRDSYFTGGVLEGAAVASTIHLFTDGDFAALTRLVADMHRMASSGESMCVLAEVDNAFHDLLFSRCDNMLLRQLSRRSCQGISKFLLYPRWCNAFDAKEMHGRHKEILDAALSRDPARIETTIRDHYIESGRRMARFGSDVTDSC